MSDHRASRKSEARRKRRASRAPSFARGTLNEALGWRPEAPDPSLTGLVNRVRTLLEMPIGELSAADIRLLLNQKVGVEILLDRALDLLDQDPLIEASYYPGDLLYVVLREALPQLAGDFALGARAVAIADRGIAATRALDENGMPRVANEIIFDLESSADRLRADLGREKR